MTGLKIMDHSIDHPKDRPNAITRMDHSVDHPKDRPNAITRVQHPHKQKPDSVGTEGWP